MRLKKTPVQPPAMPILNKENVNSNAEKGPGRSSRSDWPPEARLALDRHDPRLPGHAGEANPSGRPRPDRDAQEIRRRGKGRRKLCSMPWPETGMTPAAALPAVGSTSTFESGGEPSFVVSIQKRAWLVRPQPTVRMTRLWTLFGAPAGPNEVFAFDACELRLWQGRVAAVVGESGSGKSTLLQAIRGRVESALALTEVLLPHGTALIDAFDSSMPFKKIAELLTLCGLGEPGLWQRPASALSAGERYRARLALALAQLQGERPPRLLLCDEFGSQLHARAVKALAVNLTKLAQRFGVTVVAAMHDEALADMFHSAPMIRIKDGGVVIGSPPGASKRHAAALSNPWPNLVLDRATKSDYATFAERHYRKSAGLGFVDKVFAWRDARIGDILGIIVYAHGPLELSLRNLATEGRFVGRPDLLNAEGRMIRRLVMHRDLRGCGLGRELVSRTLPLIGVSYVECLTSMGHIHPVFERAGMKRIGVCRPPSGTRTALDALKRMGISPHDEEFVARVCHSLRARYIVREEVRAWYRRTTGRGQSRADRQSPQVLAQTFCGIVSSEPVYYAWHREGAERLRTAEEFGEENRRRD